MKAPVARRVALQTTLAGAAMLGSAQVFAADRATIETYRRLRARADGRPVFWLSYGAQIAMVGDKAIPIAGRAVVTATRFIDVGGGRFDLPFVESNCTTALETFEYKQKLVNPLSGQPVDIPLPTLRLRILRLDQDGALSQETLNPDGLKSNYDGTIGVQEGFGSQPLATQRIVITSTRPEGPAEPMVELTTFIPLGPERDGFAPCHSTTNYWMPTLPLVWAQHLPVSFKLSDVKSVIGEYHARKYASADEMRDDISPGTRAVLTPFFDQWKSMLP